MIEVVVALGVLATVMLPLASTFIWGATVDASNRENGDAIAIANGFLANAEAISYGNLGFYENQFPSLPNTVPGYDGQPGVDLGATPPAGVSGQVSAQTTVQVVGSVQYYENTYITWVNGSAPGASTTTTAPHSTTTSVPSSTTTTAPYSYAYKQVYAVVAWVEHGRTVQLDQSILVYPGGLGPYTGPQDNTPGGSTGTPDNVSGLTATALDQQTVQLTWTPPVDSTGFYAALYSQSQSDLATPSASGTDSSWSPSGSTANGPIPGSASAYKVTGLQPGTSYWFEIVAFSSDGVQWAISQSWVNATTYSATGPCTLNTLTVSQAGQLSDLATVTNGNGRLTNPITLTVTYSGTCTSTNDTVKVSATSTGNDPGSPYTLAWGANGYTYSICPTTGFATGTHTYTAIHNGTPVSLNVQVAFLTDKKAKAGC